MQMLSEQVSAESGWTVRAGVTAAVRFCTSALDPGPSTTAPAVPASPMSSDVPMANVDRVVATTVAARREKRMEPIICSFRERIRSRGANTYASVGLYAYERVGATPVAKGPCRLMLIKAVRSPVAGSEHPGRDG